MADYTPIGDGEMIADQPITQALMTRLRDNPIAIIERAPGAPTYGWTVTSTGSNANGNYRIWDDGYKEQWGSTARGGTSTTITYPVAFTTSNVDDLKMLLTDRNTTSTGGSDIGSHIAERYLTYMVVSNASYANFDRIYWTVAGY